MTAHDVTCPWCDAPPGHHCQTPAGIRPESGAHRARWKAARQQRWDTP